MATLVKPLKLYPESFRANTYSRKPFRMIGLIDASIQYYYGIERVTLAFYRSSGTNSGKIEGLWYPIVGIKTQDGEFTDFTDTINFVLTRTTRVGKAGKGWLAKSLFFSKRSEDGSKLRGFSNGKQYDFLYETGKTLRDLYEKKAYTKIRSLDAKTLNSILTSNVKYPNNKFSQKENFEHLVEDLFRQYNK